MNMQHKDEFERQMMRIAAVGQMIGLGLIAVLAFVAAFKMGILVLPL